MSNNIEMRFSTHPSAFYTFLAVITTRKDSFTGQEIPVFQTVREPFEVPSKHLSEFNRICGINQVSKMHIMYPFALTYPYIMRILSQKRIPASMFKILNTRNSIKQYRPINIDSKLGISCKNSQPRLVEKGLELDILSEISIENSVAWENCTTYFMPGRFGSADNDTSQKKMEPIAEGGIREQWYLPAEDRLRFGVLSGDTNGIHYWKPMARMLGFERDFAQPIRVVAKCISVLPDTPREHPLTLDFHLKGPVYYERTLSLVHLSDSSGTRFDLYCQGNGRPSIVGRMSE